MFLRFLRAVILNSVAWAQIWHRLLRAVAKSVLDCFRLGGQVRELDAAQSHVRATLAAITVIVDRSNCIYGVKEALAAGQFETAAGPPPPVPPSISAHCDDDDPEQWSKCCSNQWEPSISVSFANHFVCAYRSHPAYCTMPQA